MSSTRLDHRLASSTIPERIDDYFLGGFAAMASPCEVLVDTDDRAEAVRAIRVAEEEAVRIERKFSRYRADNIVHRINNSGGRPVHVDEETASILDYAAACHEMSEGMFDVTSGVLRRLWKFDGGDRVPAEGDVQALLQRVGWEKVVWQSPALTLPDGMEIDLGGIGKEYAVDRAAALVGTVTEAPFLLNFGGDLFASGARRAGALWSVGVDDPEHSGESALYRLEFSHGGLATSGNARRFVRRGGKRLGHILNPKTGRPVADAPCSVTVLGRTCLEAGTLSTLAYLRGRRASEFLREQGVEFWLA